MSPDDKKLQDNLDGKVFNEDEEEKIPAPLASPTSSSKSSSKMVSPQKVQEKLTSDEYLFQMMSKSMRDNRISHEGQIHIAENLAKFKEYFVQFLSKFETSSKKVTTKDVEEFSRGLEKLKNPHQSDEE